RLSLSLGYQFSRLSSTIAPYFANHRNVSGEAGITGNNQEAANWGPPNLNFSNGIASLGDVQRSLLRNQTGAVSAAGFWNRGRHSLSFGGDFRRQQSNPISQQDPRGSFTFTGASTSNGVLGAGSDFAGFLFGVPDTSTIAFGNADKYFRSNAYDAYVSD